MDEFYLEATGGLIPLLDNIFDLNENLEEIGTIDNVVEALVGEGY